MSTSNQLSLPGVPRPPSRRPRVHPLVHPWIRNGSGRLPVVEETSAGGICIRVTDGHPYVAVISRRNRAGKIEWCLPKGHLEGDETPAEAAQREIAEEAGVTGRIIKRLCTIDYWFSGSRARIHKTVHHYLFEYVSGTITVENDPDQEAEDAAWFPLHEAINTLAYTNERRVARTALGLLYPEY